MLSLLTLLTLTGFILGMYVYVNRSITQDGFELFERYRCPDMLVQQGSEIFLFNSKLARVPGVNPIKFNNLEEYAEFLTWQKSRGITCPVLYLRSGLNAQGDVVFTDSPGVPPMNIPRGNPTVDMTVASSYSSSSS